MARLRRAAPVSIFGAIILFGATIGNILMLQPLLIAERFGVLDYPAHLLSRPAVRPDRHRRCGPLLLGWLYDVFDGYRVPYLVGSRLLARGRRRVPVGRSGEPGPRGNGQRTSLQYEGADA